MPERALTVVLPVQLRVFISGPPGSAAAAMVSAVAYLCVACFFRALTAFPVQAAKASSELGLLVIAVKDLVKEEKGGAAPAAAKLVAAIKERVAKPDAISKGFVIADLPTGKVLLLRRVSPADPANHTGVRASAERGRRAVLALPLAEHAARGSAGLCFECLLYLVVFDQG